MCIFCDIVSKKLPSYKIYETDKVYAFLDISCDYFGHTLVVPKKHFASLSEVNKTYITEVMLATQKIVNHYKSLGYDGANVFINVGESAGQTVKHLHVHVIPKKEGDEDVFKPIKKHDFDLKKAQKTLEIKK